MESASLTSFVGREEEMTNIVQRLTDPVCRLLTLVGPGGVGKTRLAKQCMPRLAPSFSDGVEWVELQGVETQDAFLSKIAETLSFTLAGQVSPQDQLARYLAGKQILLILDNFEHLLSHSPLLASLLHETEGLKMMVASREVLHLREEWVFPIHGLPYPDDGTIDAAQASDYGAVKLFIVRARQYQSDFKPDSSYPAIVRICQLTEGLPLAIEIAASWVRSMSCMHIADQLEDNLAFLSSNLRNIPERHRSMQAVFQNMWDLLAYEERDTLARLSVFREGFDLAAADYVGQATPAILARLVDKSLLKREDTNRYHIHELLRQFVEEQLKAQDGQGIAQTVYDLHSEYYLNLLEHLLDDMLGGDQLAATAKIETDYGNIRAAWHRATHSESIQQDMARAIQCLSLFHQYKSRYREGIVVLQQASQHLQKQSLDATSAAALAGALVDNGWFHIRLGALEKARGLIEDGQQVLQQFDVRHMPGLGTDPYTALGILAVVQGAYEEALTLGETARRRNEQASDPWNLSVAFYTLTSAAFSLGDYQQARFYAQQAHTHASAGDNEWFMAYTFNDLGNVARALGNLEKAAQRYQASYAIREKFDDPEGMAVALNHLGEVALRQDDYEQARQHFHQSFDIYQKLADQGGRATALQGLGYAALRGKAYTKAWDYFGQALATAQQIQYVSLMLSVLMGMGEVLFQTGHQAKGIELFALALHHPMSTHEQHERAQHLLEFYASDLDNDDFEAAVERGKQQKLEAIAADLPTLYQSQQVAPAATSSSEQPLVDPLTPRELEVLQLIARGYSNQDIADDLVLALGTVKWYASQIYSKLDVLNRTEAVARARELNLL